MHNERHWLGRSLAAVGIGCLSLVLIADSVAADVDDVESSGNTTGFGYSWHPQFWNGSFDNYFWTGSDWESPDWAKGLTPD